MASRGGRDRRPRRDPRSVRPDRGPCGPDPRPGTRLARDSAQRITTGTTTLRHFTRENRVPGGTAARRPPRQPARRPPAAHRGARPSLGCQEAMGQVRVTVTRSSGDSGQAGGGADDPVAAPQDTAGEGDIPLTGEPEAQGPADAVRRAVRCRRERMHEPQRPSSRASSTSTRAARLASPRPWNSGRTIPPISVTGAPPSSSRDHNATGPATTSGAASPGTIILSHAPPAAAARTSRIPCPRRPRGAADRPARTS